jgi:hypothetical protein
MVVSTAPLVMRIGTIPRPNAFQERVILLLTIVVGLASPIGPGLVALLGALIDVREVFILTSCR